MISFDKVLQNFIVEATMKSLILGAAIFAAAIALYFYHGGGGVILLVLLFAPDLSMLGYLVNPRVGSLT